VPLWIKPCHLADRIPSPAFVSARYLRRGVEPEARNASVSPGRDATLVVRLPNYDGKGKPWVRFDDGTDAIVGGSRVER